MSLLWSAKAARKKIERRRRKISHNHSIGDDHKWKKSVRLRFLVHWYLYFLDEKVQQTFKSDCDVKSGIFVKIISSTF